MAKTTTTLASACGASDTTIVVAASTGFAAGNFVELDGEVLRVNSNYTTTANGVNVPVLRGQNGGYALAHPSGATAVTGLASDFANAVPQQNVTYPIAGRGRTVTSYTADGAITLPTAGSDAVAILNGTVQWDMTVAAPTAEMVGSILIIVGNGKSAHTVTVAGGLGLGSTGYTIGTFDTNAQCALMLIAAGVAWVPLPSPLSGTLTGIDIAIS